MDAMQKMEMRLWDYIDGATPSAEKEAVEKLIAENREWQAKYHELLNVHQSINLIELEEPSLRFTKNVMDGIAKYQIAPAAKAYINKKIIWGIAAFFITIILGFLIYAIAQVDWSVGNDQKTALGIDFTRVDYGWVFNNAYINTFIMLNAVLGLMFLDRYLANKRKKFFEET